VRRALLKGAALESPAVEHCQRNYTAVGPGTGRAEVLDLMQARRFGQIPIVDEEGTLLGLHLLHDILGSTERPNWAVIMAGGQGTRLRPLTEKIPKPMVPVAGRPILERLVLHLVGFGIRRIFLAIHYLGHTIEDYFKDGSTHGARIEYLREEEPRGSGGALSLLPGRPEDPLLVMNGDLVTQADLGSLLGFHETGGYRATVAVRPYHHKVPFGCVEERDGRVVSIEEKPLVSRLINAGIYVLSPDLLERVPRQGAFPLPSLIDDCLARGESVGAWTIQEDWIDVGQAEHLHIAREGGL